MQLRWRLWNLCIRGSYEMMSDQFFWQWICRKNSIMKKYGPAGPPLVLRHITAAQRVLHFWHSVTFRLNAAAGRSSSEYVAAGRTSSVYATEGRSFSRYAAAGRASFVYPTAGPSSFRYAIAGWPSSRFESRVISPVATALLWESLRLVTALKEHQGLKAPAGPLPLGDAAIKRVKLFPSPDIERYAPQKTLQTLAIWHNKAVGQVGFSQTFAAASLLSTRAFYSPVNESLVTVSDLPWPVMFGYPIKVASPMTIKSSATAMHTATSIERSTAVKQARYTAEYATETIRYVPALAGVAQNSVGQAPGSVNRPLTSRGKGSVADVNDTNIIGYRSRTALASHSHTSVFHTHALYTTTAANIPLSAEIIHATAKTVHEPVEIKRISAITIHKPAEIKHTPAMTIHESLEIKHFSATAIHEPAEIIHAAATPFHEPMKIKHASDPATTIYKPSTIVQAPDSTVQGITAPSTASVAEISRLADQVYRIIEGKLTREKERRGM